MRGNNRWGAGLAIALGVMAAGCSSSKYENQIEQQKLQISELQQRNYQLEMDLSKQRAVADDLAKRQEAAPVDRGGATLGGETAGVSFGGGGASPGVSERIVLDSEVLFSSGSATLTTKGIAAVKSVAGQIKSKYPGHQIVVEGHTDNVPIKKAKDKFASNWELSTARANSVAKVLRENGIPSGTIQVAGLGDTKPAASNSTAAGRAKNRRVEITVLQ